MTSDTRVPGGISGGMVMHEPVTFLKQTLKTFRTTGAIAPSSPFLGRAMVKQLPRTGHFPADFRVLEVGPGTGPITEVVAKRMHGQGHLELWEINPDFVEHLRRRIEKQKCFEPMRARIHIEQGDIRSKVAGPHYDAILSGLPFNNFSPDEVTGFLEHFRALLKPGGTLSYFEYVAIRKLQAPFVSKERRVRLKVISQVVEEFAREHQLKSDIVPINFPPARVRHLCFRP